MDLILSVGAGSASACLVLGPSLPFGKIWASVGSVEWATRVGMPYGGISVHEKHFGPLPRPPARAATSHTFDSPDPDTL